MHASVNCYLMDELLDEEHLLARAAVRVWPNPEAYPDYCEDYADRASASHSVQRSGWIRLSWPSRPSEHEGGGTHG